MNISENILRFNLKNVYFVIGTPCAGKTTLCKAISDKYGIPFFNSNHRDSDFKNWQEISHPDYQKVSAQKVTDWEYFFNRPTEEYIAWLDSVGEEYFEYAVLELIKMAQKSVVITDINIPVDLILKISSYDHIAGLVTSPDIVVRDYYNREDHRDIYECILSLKNPQQSLENNREVLRMVCRKTRDEICKSGLFWLERDENSTVEKTLSLLEEHFHLV